MTTNELLVKSIMAELPQIVFVTEQVATAIELAKENLSEDGFNRALRVTLEVTKFARETSQENYFKYHLVVITVLSSVPEVTKLKGFKKFETMNNIVEAGISELETTAEELTRGDYKGLLLKLARLYNSNQELFLVTILEMMDDFCYEYDSVDVGFAYIEANLRMSDLNLLSPIRTRYNKFMQLLEKAAF